MRRAHYIVRVGNVGFAATYSSQAPNHWHYLSPQHLWGLPKDLTTVKVRAAFVTDIANLDVTTYIWFLCNSHGGPGHFVQVGIGRHVGNGPARSGERPIPEDVMARLQQGFDHWFNWEPVSLDERFLEKVRQIATPKPTYIPTLRRVTADHPSFSTFQDLIDGVDRLKEIPVEVPTPEVEDRAVTSAVNATIELDLGNLRREQAEPNSQGFVYLIHMEGTIFYKIGMSLSPQVRLQTLQTGNPRNLRIVNTQVVSDMRTAESGLHRRFEAQRVPDVSAREWFKFRNGVAEVQTAFSAIR